MAIYRHTILTARAASFCFAVICFSLLSSARVVAASAVEFDELFFFEGGRDAQIPHRTSPQIKNSFDNSGVRYIYSVIRLKNKRWKESAQDLVINVRYLRADGGLVGEPGISQHIPADWEYATLWAGWGWDTQNKWEAGAYRVELWLDNKEKIGEGDFHLESSANSVAGSRIVSSSVGVRFDKMGFFESSAESTEKVPDDWSDERLKNTFRKSDARYIFTLVSLKNRLWQKQEQDVSINVRYYHADGRLFDVALINYTVPATWEHAELSNGSGWPQPGNWETGRYRVELWLNDNQKIGESHFTVH